LVSRRRPCHVGGGAAVVVKKYATQRPTRHFICTAACRSAARDVRAHRLFRKKWLL
jgi:hypothetical protein